MEKSFSINCWSCSLSNFFSRIALSAQSTPSTNFPAKPESSKMSMQNRQKCWCRIVKNVDAESSKMLMRWWKYIPDGTFGIQKRSFSTNPFVAYCNFASLSTLHLLPDAFQSGRNLVGSKFVSDFVTSGSSSISLTMLFQWMIWLNQKWIIWLNQKLRRMVKSSFKFGKSSTFTF